MKILIVAPDVPNPPYTGGQLRCFHVLKHLAARHEIFFVGLTRLREREKFDDVAQYCAGMHVMTPQVSPYQRPRIKALQRIHWRWHELTRKPEGFLREESSELSQVIQQTVRDWQPDIIQVEDSPIGQHLLSLPRFGQEVRALVMHNVISQLEKQKMLLAQSRAERVKGWLDWKKAIALEKRICRAFDVFFTMSEADEQIVRRLYGLEKIFVSPNGVDVQAYRPPPVDASKPEILFTGLMLYAPNHDGALWFGREIFPLIQREISDAHFTIMGRFPKPEVESLASAHVTVTGEVPDAQPYFERAAVCVVPLRLGSGTRLKILEAFAMGKAVVSTTLGAEGLEAASGRHLLMEDDPASFAAAVVRLLKDPNLRQQLGQAGRTLAVRRYDWRQIGDGIERAYESAMRPALRNTQPPNHPTT
jgi:glycosyltransferase involved in cell wall biosynthesis